MTGLHNEEYDRIEALEAEIERLHDLLRDVRAEIDLRKSPKLLERIEAALTAAKHTGG